MKELYLAIINKFDESQIKEKFLNAGFSYVKHVNLYSGQDYDNDADAFLTPALFLNWEIDYTPNTPIATITVKLVYENLRDTSSISRTKEKALSFIEFIDAVDNELKQIETEYTSRLTLTNESFNIEPTPSDVVSLIYTCNYTKKFRSFKVAYESGTIEKTPINPNLFQKESTT